MTRVVVCFPWIHILPIAMMHFYQSMETGFFVACVLAFPLLTAPAVSVLLSALLMVFSTPYRDCTQMRFFHKWSLIRLSIGLSLSIFLVWAGTLDKYGLALAWLFIAVCRPHTPAEAPLYGIDEDDDKKDTSWAHHIAEIGLLVVYAIMTMLVSYVASWHTLSGVHRLIGFWVLFSPVIFAVITHFMFKVLSWHNYAINIQNLQVVFTQNCTSHLWLIKTVAIWKVLVPLSAPQRSVAPLSMLYFALVELCKSQVGWLQTHVYMAQPSLLTLWECLTVACVTQRVYPVDGTVFVERLLAVSVYHVFVAWRAFQLEHQEENSKSPRSTPDLTLGKLSLYAMIAGFMVVFKE